jgi:hypothetical protein
MPHHLQQQRNRKRRRAAKGIFPRLLVTFFGTISTVESYLVTKPDLPQNILSVPPNDVPLSTDHLSDLSDTFIGNNNIELSDSAMIITAQPIVTPAADAVLSPLEAWCLSRMDQWYSKSQSVKCPFLRRRSGDVLDTLETLMKYTVIRKECWPLLGPPQAHRPAGTNKKTNSIKHKGMLLSELKDYVLQDWKPQTDGKGYYVTGKLTTAVYRDDCLFLGPDPDLPIRGLRKYVGVAAHLFDFDTSRAILHSLEINNDDQILIANWTMSGILRLPWKPSLPTFSGQTIYYVDEDGLISCHEESWDCSVLRAFCHTLLPDLAETIWKNNEKPQN